MKMLFWKELREQRWTPMMYGILMLVAMLWISMAVRHGDAQSVHSFHTHIGDVAVESTPLQTEIVQTLGVLLCLGLPLAGLSATRAVAPEIGRGTLAFLSVLPSGRARIWWAKAAVGGLITIASVLVMVVLFCGAIFCFYGVAGLQIAGALMQTIVNNHAAQNYVAIVPFGFAVSLFCSTLFDRTSTAACATVIGGAICGILLLAAANWVTHGHGASLIFWLLLLSIPAFLSASYFTFCHGGTLRTPRRFDIAGATLTPWIFTGALGLMFYMMAHRV
jgi:ABC-type Fe3+-siderophore transport system permease subunit